MRGGPPSRGTVVYGPALRWCRLGYLRLEWGKLSTKLIFTSVTLAYNLRPSFRIFLLFILDVYLTYFFKTWYSKMFDCSATLANRPSALGRRSAPPRTMWWWMTSSVPTITRFPHRKTVILASYRLARSSGMLPSGVM